MDLSSANADRIDARNSILGDVCGIRSAVVSTWSKRGHTVGSKDSVYLFGKFEIALAHRHSRPIAELADTAARSLHVNGICNLFHIFLDPLKLLFCGKSNICIEGAVSGNGVDHASALNNTAVAGDAVVVLESLKLDYLMSRLGNGRGTYGGAVGRMRFDTVNFEFIRNDSLARHANRIITASFKVEEGDRIA